MDSIPFSICSAADPDDKMSANLRDVLGRQYDMAWKLLSYHLETLTTEECLWRPATAGLHVSHAAGNGWCADWPEHEGYDLGPPSIAWLSWHACYWYAMLNDHTFGSAALAREQVRWPGGADAVRGTLRKLHEEWRSAITRATDAEWESQERTRWPFRERSLADLVAWSTIELTKSAAEIGYARFLYAARPR